MKEKFARKIKMGEKGSFNGIAMSVGVPEGKPFFEFTKESIAENVGKSAMLMLDHSQRETLKSVGKVKFVSFDGKNLMFEAQLLMDAKDVAENVHPRIKEGILDGVSVGVEFEEFEERKDGTWLIKKFSINELSIVPFPAFKKARIKNAFSEEEKTSMHDNMKKLFLEAGVQVKDKICIEDLKKLTKRDFETILNEIGFSNSVSVKLSCIQGDLGSDEGQGDLGEFADYLKETIKNQ